MKKIQYLIFLLCAVVGFSCSVDEGCRTSRSVFLELGIYHVNKTDTSRIVSAMYIDSLTVRGLKFDSLSKKYVYVDSIIYNRMRGLSKINLPLHNFEPISIFEITFNNKTITKNILTGKNDTTLILNKKDTLTISHENKDDYLSLECGTIKIHSIDTANIIKHFADSIKIINRIVNNVNAENIQIYR